MGYTGHHSKRYHYHCKYNDRIPVISADPVDHLTDQGRCSHLGQRRNNSKDYHDSHLLLIEFDSGKERFHNRHSPSLRNKL